MGIITDMQKLEEIHQGVADLRGALADAMEMIKTLRQAAHIDQATIQLLRQERLVAINEADAYREERDDLRAKLAQAQQRPVSRGGRVPR